MTVWQERQVSTAVGRALSFAGLRSPLADGVVHIVQALIGIATPGHQLYSKEFDTVDPVDPEPA